MENKVYCKECAFYKQGDKASLQSCEHSDNVYIDIMDDTSPIKRGGKSFYIK